MTGVVLVSPKNQFFDSSGAPLAGGTVTTYVAGTTTLATTYQDKDLLTANTNPITLNARGECSIWGSSTSTYKWVVKDSSGATIYTEDNIPGGADVGAAATAAAAAAAPYVTAAQLAETNAETAQAAAEAALASLLAAAGVYADTTAGLAATASGGYFFVPSSDTYESFILYKDNAGVAEEIKRLTRMDLAQFTGDPRFVITDADGNIVFDSDEVRPEYEEITGEARLVVTDASDNVVFDSDEINEHLDAHVTDRTLIRAQYDYGYSVNSLAAIAEMVHIILYGQSLATGYNSSAFSTTALSYAKRFVAGIRAQDGAGTSAVNHGSLVNLIETTNSGTTEGETGMYAMAHMMQQLLQDENGVTFTDLSQTLLCSAPGVPGATISNLAGGTGYPRLTDDITYGRSNSDSLSKTYQVGAITWRQGEADYSAGTTKAAYKTALQSMRSSITATAQSGAGTTREVPLITYQTATHNAFGGGNAGTIAQAQLDLVSEDSNITMSAPTYFLPYSDSAHLTNIGYAWLGAYEALALKRWLFDGVKPKPLMPLAATVVGNCVIVQFNVPWGSRLVFDTTQVAAQTNYGFQLVTIGNVAIPVTGVSLIGRDKVKLTTGSDRSAGDKVRYAWQGDANKGLGNLRDNQGDALVCDYLGHPLHRWCPIFELATA